MQGLRPPLFCPAESLHRNPLDDVARDLAPPDIEPGRPPCRPQAGRLGPGRATVEATRQRGVSPRGPAPALPDLAWPGRPPTVRCRSPWPAVPVRTGLAWPLAPSVWLRRTLTWMLLAVIMGSSRSGTGRFSIRRRILRRRSWSNLRFRARVLPELRFADFLGIVAITRKPLLVGIVKMFY